MVNQQMLELLKQTPEQLFGTEPDKAHAQYQKLLRITHPDMNLDCRSEATKAFQHINHMWTKTQEAPKHNSPTVNRIRTKRHEYTLQNIRYKNDAVAYYNAEYDDGHKTTTVTFPVTPKLNSIAAEGNRNLKAVRSNTPDEYKLYFPEIIDSFKIDNNGQRLTAASYDGLNDLYSLAEVKEDYPEGLNGRDIGWMFRRLLVALGNTHDAGYIHGASNLNSVLIHPKYHGMVLKDWQYSVEKGQAVKSFPKTTQSWYTENIKAGGKLDTQTDLKLAAHTMLELTGNKTPVKLQKYLRMFSKYAPDTASEGLEEYNDVLYELYGKPKFNVFNMRRK